MTANEARTALLVNNTGANIVLFETAIREVAAGIADLDTTDAVDVFKIEIHSDRIIVDFAD